MILIPDKSEALPADAHSPAAEHGTARPETGTQAALKPWDKIQGETGSAYSAFSLFRDLGTARSLSAAYRLHLEAGRKTVQTGRKSGGKRTESDGSGADAAQDTPRTTEAPGRWREWAKKYSWRSRADAYDQHFATIRLQEAERVTKSFSAEFAGARELLLVGLLKLQTNYLRGSQAESENGKLIERVIRRVGRDANGEPVQQEESFSAAQQIELLLTLDKFLFGEVKAITASAGESTGDEDNWVTMRLRQIAAEQGTKVPDWIDESLRRIPQKNPARDRGVSGAAGGGLCRNCGP